MGATGSGKSSIVRLIARAYGGYEGSIRLNGEEITSFDADRIGRMVSVVHQNVFLFHGSVEFNITLGRLEPAAAERAARQVQADAFIRALPGGYRFEVAHGGANLSAGQAQLISFARAVAADAELVVLDEATSSVDSMTEELIERALARLYETRTVIAIAHRLSTIRGADRIVVLEAGEVVETGTHDELVRRAGAYARLVARIRTEHPMTHDSGSWPAGPKQAPSSADRAIRSRRSLPRPGYAAEYPDLMRPAREYFLRVSAARPREHS